MTAQQTDQPTLEEIAYSPRFAKLREVLDRGLPNEGINLVDIDNIDFDKWRIGIDKFMNDNKDVLLGMVADE